MLKKGVEWNVIERMPRAIRLLPIPRTSTARFHDFDQYERLVEEARAIHPNTELIVLLGGEAGLRCGEIIALEWRDIDLAMRGAPARAIQELVGHSELGVTQRYMHLSPAALDAAIQLLDGRGNMVATAVGFDREVGKA